MNKPTFSDRDCRKFLKSMHEFGYPSLKFDTVQPTDTTSGTHEPERQD